MPHVGAGSIAVMILATAGSTGFIVWVYLSSRSRSDTSDKPKRRSQRLERSNEKSCTFSCCCYEKLIGSTPLVRLDNLSKLLKRSIYVKMESMNPGGTGKDRAAWSMIRAAEEAQQLPYPIYASQNQNGTTKIADVDHAPEYLSGHNDGAIKLESSNENTGKSYDEIILAAGKLSKTGGIVVEGTSGSTGISLAILSASRGHGCIVVLPDDQAIEKRLILQSLGAQVQVVPTASISNPHHYVNIARRIAERARMRWGYHAVFIDQFENTANFQIHYEETGPEIYQACPHIDAFVMSSGTGGTIAGVGKFLKEQTNGKVQIVLVDPPGSSLYNRIEHGVAYATQQAELGLRRHRYDTLAEGIGLDRITHNFAIGESFVDNAIRVEDQHAVDMAHWLLTVEGLFVGSSSCMNLVGAVETAVNLPQESNVVTVICDSGQRHLTRFWNRDFCLSRGLIWPGDCDRRIPGCLIDYVK